MNKKFAFGVDPSKKPTFKPQPVRKSVFGSKETVWLRDSKERKEIPKVEIKTTDWKSLSTSTPKPNVKPNGKIPKSSASTWGFDPPHIKVLPDEIKEKPIIPRIPKSDFVEPIHVEPVKPIHVEPKPIEQKPKENGIMTDKEYQQWNEELEKELDEELERNKKLEIPKTDWSQYKTEESAFTRLREFEIRVEYINDSDENDKQEEATITVNNNKTLGEIKNEYCREIIGTDKVDDYAIYTGPLIRQNYETVKRVGLKPGSLLTVKPILRTVFKPLQAMPQTQQQVLKEHEKWVEEHEHLQKEANTGHFSFKLSPFVEVSKEYFKTDEPNLKPKELKKIQNKAHNLRLDAMKIRENKPEIPNINEKLKKSNQQQVELLKQKDKEKQNKKEEEAEQKAAVKKQEQDKKIAEIKGLLSGLKVKPISEINKAKINQNLKKQNEYLYEKEVEQAIENEEKARPKTEEEYLQELADEKAEQDETLLKEYEEQQKLDEKAKQYAQAEEEEAERIRIENEKEEQRKREKEEEDRLYREYLNTEFAINYVYKKSYKAVPVLYYAYVKPITTVAELKRIFLREVTRFRTEKFYHFSYKNIFLDKSYDKTKLEELGIKNDDEILVMFDSDIKDKYRETKLYKNIKKKLAKEKEREKIELQKKARYDAWAKKEEKKEAAEHPIKIIIQYLNDKNERVNREMMVDRLTTVNSIIARFLTSEFKIKNATIECMNYILIYKAVILDDNDTLDKLGIVQWGETFHLSRKTKDDEDDDFPEEMTKYEKDKDRQAEDTFIKTIVENKKGSEEKWKHELHELQGTVEEERKRQEEEAAAEEKKKKREREEQIAEEARQKQAERTKEKDLTHYFPKVEPQNKEPKPAPQPKPKKLTDSHITNYFEKIPKKEKQRQQTIEEASEPRINLDPKEFRDGQVYFVRDTLEDNQEKLENANPQNDGELTENAVIREQNRYLIDNLNEYVHENKRERKEPPKTEFQTESWPTRFLNNDYEDTNNPAELFNPNGPKGPSGDPIIFTQRKYFPLAEGPPLPPVPKEEYKLEPGQTLRRNVQTVVTESENGKSTRGVGLGSQRAPEPKKDKNVPLDIPSIKYTASWKVLNTIMRELLYKFEYEGLNTGILAKKLTEEEFRQWMNRHKEFSNEEKAKYKKIYQDYLYLYNETEKDMEPELDYYMPLYTRDGDMIREYERKIQNLEIPKTISIIVSKSNPNIIKRKVKYMRPYFSPQPYSWEIDHLLYHKSARYLICININTRYLYAIPVNDKTKQESCNAIIKLILYEQTRFKHPVKYIRFDGDKGFLAVKRYFESQQDENSKIIFNSESSPYTNHNRMVDRAIRRLRNLTNNDYEIFDGTRFNNRKIQQVVFYYNTFLHHGIGKLCPLDMHTDINKEWKYIREKTEELEEQKKRQIEAGMWNYKKDVTELRMYLDPDKTKNMFDKNRRKFKTYGLFQEYRHGNVVAKLRDGRIVEVPIYYTIPDTPTDVERHPNAARESNPDAKCVKALKDKIPGFDKDEPK